VEVLDDAPVGVGGGPAAVMGGCGGRCEERDAERGGEHAAALAEAVHDERHWGSSLSE
jgi:hypothetical protein